MQILIRVTVTPKEECEMGAGCDPLPGEVATYIAQHMHYETRDDYQLPWTITAADEI